jgi:AraC-like DNA-binding protein
MPSDHLTLRQIRVRKSGELAREAAGFHFVFPRSGAGFYVSEKLSQPLGQGEVLVSNGTGEGKIRASVADDFICWTFSLTVEHLLPLLAAGEISLLQPLEERLRPIKVYPANTRLACECHRLLGEVPPQDNLAHRAQLLRIAATVLNEEFQTIPRVCKGFSQAEKHLVQVFENLSADELLALPVDELATKFGCSRRHLNRVFRQYFKVSVATLKMEMRLLKAICLLRDEEAKIINVAAECGFNHLGLFNTCFRRRFGTTPSEWRKNSGELQKRHQLGPHLDAQRLLLAMGMELQPGKSASPGQGK